MKKWMFMTAVASVMLLGSCSTDGDVPQNMEEARQKELVPVSFGTYMGNDQKAETRSGYTGNIGNTELGSQGFGVIGVYTKGESYNSLSAAEDKTPDFMYNEKIISDGSGGWKYAVTANTKYWPNDFVSGAVDPDTNPSSGAGTGGKVSFFAYAPYVDVNYSSTPKGQAGDTTFGITALSANDAGTENPSLSYTIKEGSFVDVLWGTANGSDVNVLGGSNAGDFVTTTNWYYPNGGSETVASSPTGSQVPVLGNVNIDLTKQKTGGKVKFLFKHALAQFGNYQDDATKGGLQIKLDVDATDDTSANTDTKTRVTINSIKITSDESLARNKIYTQGVLDLATGYWKAASGSPTVVIKRQIVPSSTSPITDGYTRLLLNPEIADPGTVSTSGGDWTSGMVAGVVGSTLKNVYKTAPDALVFFPGTQPKFTFEVDYFVRTADNKLAQGYSEVRQKISKTVEFGKPVEMNKIYNMIIHLGLTSVKFEATVSDWENATMSGVSGTEVVHLPINVD